MERAASRLIDRRRALAGFGAAAVAGAAGTVRADNDATVAARLVQGGFTMGRTKPRGLILVDGKAEGSASASGLYIVGFDRDSAAKVTVGLDMETWALARSGIPSAVSYRTLSIAPVSYDIQHVDGLPPETVTPTKPDIIARIAAERVKKVAAAESRDDSEDFRDGFVLPLDHPIRTSPFGVQRVLNGEPKPPHYGLDLAAPQGTPIHAPAPGLVVLAEPDLFLEGGLVMIDHGQGLISFYLHQSRVVAKAGERIRRGQLIGEVGMKGRATGPHLCWRLGWRGRHMDPSLLIGAGAPSAING